MLRQRRRRGPGRAVPHLLGLVRNLPHLVGLVLGLLRDRRVSRADRVLVVLALAYALSPLDLIPDVLGVLGLVDDASLVALAVERLLARAAPEVVRAHWRGRPERLERARGALSVLAASLGSILRRRHRLRPRTT